ncbi:hypothetical protein HDC90_003103 [Pedobacter sp. AK013]|uniref:hypothetical protein n=1 Tax=Pedobacter sp. AK013 TaxID=2723071 RepID=UPI00161C8CF9|nr:hypothetical protein [Pedobacter sp. AK013]MBB6238470.1 hypothetical protein [Pedobacter sp. AK013]
MKHFNILFFAALLTLSSCTTNYYLTVSDAETPIFSTSNEIDQSSSIASGKAFVYSRGTKNAFIKYGSITGYSAKLRTWKKLKKLSKEQADNLKFTDEYGYVYDGIPVIQYRYGKLIKNNTSSVSSSSTSRSTTSSGGTVHVKGYTRKNGTYVSPHTRSAPRRH